MKRSTAVSRTMASAGVMVGISIFLVATVGGCAGSTQTGGMRAVALHLKKPMTIPANFAHAKFQGGRQVGGVNRYFPWCELEIATVSEKPQRVEPGRFRVRRVDQAFLKDYNTRVSAVLAGFSCDDLVFQETRWMIDPGTSPQVVYLRCLAPYTNCRLGPPPSPQQMQEIVGPTPLLDWQVVVSDP